jgi:hypothetical protein
LPELTSKHRAALRKRWANRAADALQFVAALVSCEEEPIGERLVSLDQRLREAALLEGFVVIPE